MKIWRGLSLSPPSKILIRLAKSCVWTILILEKAKRRMVIPCMVMRSFQLPKPWTPRQEKNFLSIIEDHDTYLRNAIPMDCLFRPGVAFRFSDQQNQVDLLICFSCNELRYYLNGRVVGQSYFKSQNLRSLVQQLFPEDEKIQKL